MSYIFRSDAVEVGERVVARREIDGMHTDVIGHVLSSIHWSSAPKKWAAIPPRWKRWRSRRRN